MVDKPIWGQIPFDHTISDLPDQIECNALKARDVLFGLGVRYLFAQYEQQTPLKPVLEALAVVSRQNSTLEHKSIGVARFVDAVTYDVHNHTTAPLISDDAKTHDWEYADERAAVIKNDTSRQLMDIEEAKNIVANLKTHLQTAVSQGAREDDVLSVVDAVFRELKPFEKNVPTTNPWGQHKPEPAVVVDTVRYELPDTIDFVSPPEAKNIVSAINESLTQDELLALYVATDGMKKPSVLKLYDALDLLSKVADEKNMETHAIFGDDFISGMIDLSEGPLHTLDEKEAAEAELARETVSNAKQVIAEIRDHLQASGSDNQSQNLELLDKFEQAIARTCPKQTQAPEVNKGPWGKG